MKKSSTNSTIITRYKSSVIRLTGERVIGDNKLQKASEKEKFETRKIIELLYKRLFEKKK